MNPQETNHVQTTASGKIRDQLNMRAEGKGVKDRVIYNPNSLD
jgi:hypothetical protein